MYYNKTIFQVKIKDTRKHTPFFRKIISFDDMNKALEFYLYQKENNIEVSKIEMVHDRELDSFKKWKQDNCYGEYADEYTLEDGLESNGPVLEHWYFLRNKLEKELEIKIKEDTLQESDDILIETLERVCAVMSCDFGNYTEEFNKRFWKPYFYKFEEKAV